MSVSVLQAPAVLALTSIEFLAAAEGKSSEQQIEETLRALPEALRPGATVVGYDESGQRTVLKRGTNDIICWADDANSSDGRGAFFVNCFPKSLEQYENRRHELRGRPDAGEVLKAEVESGKVTLPTMAARYTLRGGGAAMAVSLTVIMVPYATPESSGLSAEPDNHRPWLMSSGEWNAHIMLPGQ